MSDARKTSDWWNTINFEPAPPGWRVIYLHASGRDVVPIAGWLIQERYTQGPGDDPPLLDTLDEDEQITGRARRVIPGTVNADYGWRVDPIGWLPGTDIWQVLPPGAPNPTDEEEQEERARRARRANGGNA